MSKLSKDILGRIKKDNITPISRWRFVVLHAILWILVTLAVVFGSMAMSVIFRVIDGADWEIARQVGKNSFHSFALILPYIWIAVLGLIIFLASKLFEHTKKGYRYGHFVVAASSVVISVVFGAGLYFVGVGDTVHAALSNNVPTYAQWEENRDKMMVAPDRGALVGRITEFKSDDEIVLVDLKGNVWEVDISNAEIQQESMLRARMPIGVIGGKTSENTFNAKRIVPWRPDKKPPIAPQQLRGKNIKRPI